MNRAEAWSLRCVAALCVCLYAATTHCAETRRDFGGGLQIKVQDGRAIALQGPMPAAAAGRKKIEALLKDDAALKKFRQGGALLIPYAWLNDDTQRRVLKVLFPNDTVDESGWKHTVLFGGSEGSETWWTIAEWFTGAGTRHRDLVAVPANAAIGDSLQKGQTVLVPANLLKPAFRAPAKKSPPPAPAPKVALQPATPVAADSVEAKIDTTPEPEDPDGTGQDVSGMAETPAAPPETKVEDSDLAFGRDGNGQYASYRLKPGEAIYGVVTRFTGIREKAAIEAACAAIQKRSSIADPHKLREGQVILIPVELLAEPYRATGDTAQPEILTPHAAPPAASGTKDLEGVVVILDPGHGGRDRGAAIASAGMYEDEITYELCLRLKLLLQKTHARVYTTIYDPDDKGVPSKAARFSADTDECLGTTPVYWNEDGQVSVNLRWYLANSIIRSELKRGTKLENILFVSIHCDSIANKTLRGTKVYIPGAKYRVDKEVFDQPIYAQYAEAKGRETIKTTEKERKRDEARSRNFAEIVVKSLKTNKPAIKVHSAGEAIRDVVARSKSQYFLPAVLRNTQAPTKVLIEAANLSNASDRANIADWKWRQAYAEALLRAIKTYFGA